MSENQIMAAVAAIAMLAAVLVSWARSGTLPGVGRTIVGGLAAAGVLVAIALVAEKLAK